MPPELRSCRPIAGLVGGPPCPVDLGPRHRLRAPPPLVEEVLRVLHPYRRTRVAGGPRERLHGEFEQEHGLLAPADEAGVEHLARMVTERKHERSVRQAGLRVEGVIRYR